MTQKEKELLLRDLSARLPYGVILNTPNGNKPLLALVSSKEYNTIIEYDDYHGFENDITEWEGGDVELIKPYLRPLSSMTEEEEIGYDATFATIIYDDGHRESTMTYESFDWLNAHYFDCRGLIEKGLALPAPKGMYDNQ